MDVPDALYDRARELARSRTCDTYGNVGDLIHLDMQKPADRRTIGVMLSEINRYEDEENRPLLSAVVVRKGKCKPSNGFYRSAVELLKMDPFRGRLFWQSEKATRFWEAELRRVHDYWSRH